MSATEQEYKDHIKELEQQIRLLKEQVDFLTRKLYGTKSEKASTLEIEGQMSLFNEIEAWYTVKHGKTSWIRCLDTISNPCISAR